MSDNNQENINENNFDQSIKKEKKSKKDKKEKKEKKERKRRQRELEMLEKKPETATTNVNDQANDKTINDDGLKDKIPSSDNSEKSTDDLQNDTTRTNSSVKFKNQENSDKSDDSAKAASSTDEKKDTSKSAGEIDKAKSETRIDIPVERQKSFGETLTRKQVYMIVTALCLGLFMGAMDNTITTVALPKITTELEATTDQYSWPVIAYLLTATALAPSYGRMSDLYGRRTVYLVVLTVFLVGSALCGASVTMDMLIASRAIQGVGGGGLMGLGFVVVADVTHPRERGKFLGIMGAMFALSSVLGPLIGGLLTDHASWRWCFYINLPIGIVVAILLFFAFRQNYKTISGKTTRLDWTGTLIMVVAITMLELGISWGGDRYPWDDALIIILLVVGAFLLVPFALSQRDAPLPIMPLHLFQKRNVILPAFCSFFIGLFMFVGYTYLPLWFQTVQGYSATFAGLQMIAYMFGLIAASTTAGLLMAKYGRYKIFPVIGTLLMPVGCGLFYLFDLDSNQGTFIPVLIVAGISIGLTIQIVTVIAQNEVPLKDIAVATTLINFSRSIGGSIGVAMFGATFNNQYASILVDLANTELESQLISSGGLVAYVTSLAIRRAFLYFTPVVALGFIFIIFTKDNPLRTTLDKAPVMAE